MGGDGDDLTRQFEDKAWADMRAMAHDDLALMGQRAGKSDTISALVGGAVRAAVREAEPPTNVVFTSSYSGAWKNPDSFRLHTGDRNAQGHMLVSYYRDGEYMYAAYDGKPTNIGNHDDFVVSGGTRRDTGAGVTVSIVHTPREKSALEKAILARYGFTPSKHSKQRRRRK